MARRTLAWELGGRDDATCRRLLDKVGVEGNVFLTDDWDGFHRLIPAEQLFTGKDLTFPIEQDNGDVRHHLARFRRRSVRGGDARGVGHPGGRKVTGNIGRRRPDATPASRCRRRGKRAPRAPRA